jgi:hypothetical protein
MSSLSCGEVKGLRMDFNYYLVKFTPIIESEAQAIRVLEKNKEEKSHLNHT